MRKLLCALRNVPFKCPHKRITVHPEVSHILIPNNNGPQVLMVYATIVHEYMEVFAFDPTAASTGGGNLIVSYL
jgi:hypothetical protein